MIIKKINKKIIISLIILLAAGASYSVYSVYAAGVVFFGSASAQTIVTFSTVGTRTWTVPEGVTTVEVLTVAGGGGGGMDMGGGGGGGGVIYNGDYSVTPGSNVTVTVGTGGNGAPAANTNGQPGGHQYTISATSGQNSVFGSITALGGGYGGSSYYGYTPNYGLGGSGGSGGGSSGYTAGATTIGAAGTAGQGFKGGNAGGTSYASGGGGGAGGPGADAPNQANGGPGILYPSISSYYFGGGGGGAAYTLANGGNGGIGGGGGGAIGTTYGGAGLNNGAPGGGGDPNSWGNRPGGDAGANTGGGGGGGSHYNANNKGGNGGSGIVIIRYGKSKMAVSSIDSGLVGHWALDGDGYNASTGRVTDKTPYENHGTNNGATLTTDRMEQANGAMSFDGSNTIDFGDPSSGLFDFGTGDFSISLWFKASEVGSNGCISNPVIRKGELSCNGYTIGIDWGGMNFYANCAGIGFAYPNDNLWHHLVGVRYYSGMLFYNDGVLVAQNSSAPVNISSTDSLVIGKPYCAGAAKGSISDVRIYNRALSAAEVATLYGAYKPKVSAGYLQQGLILDMPLTLNYTKTVTAGSEIMTDRTPYSRDGQNYGATVGSDSSNFVEESDVVSVPGAFLNNLPQLTESAWINPNTLCEGSRTDWDIFLSRADPWGYMGFYRSGGTFVPRFYLALSGGAQSVDAPISVSTNQWYHVAGVYDGAKMKIYINGVEENSVNASGVTATTGDSLAIGDYHVDYHAVSPNAQMSGVKIYSRALSATEVKSLYDKGR